MSVWYYMKDGQQVGPIETVELKALALHGTLQPTDLIWKEGLAEWVQAGRTKGLFPTAVPAGAGRLAVAQARVAHATHAGVTPQLTRVQASESDDRHAAHAAAVAPAPATVGYFSAASGLPSRAADALRRFPPRTGPTDEWPLDDRQLRQLQKTGRVRQLLVFLSGYFLLTAVSGAVACLYVIVLFITATLHSSRGLDLPWQAWIAVLLLFGGNAAAWICWRPTRQAKAWACYTMLAVQGATMVYGFYALYEIVSTMGGLNGDAILTGVFPLLIFEAWLLAIGYFCFRATILIPQFLDQPVWCQEALVNSYF